MTWLHIMWPKFNFMFCSCVFVSPYVDGWKRLAKTYIVSNFCLQQFCYAICDFFTASVKQPKGTDMHSHWYSSTCSLHLLNVYVLVSMCASINYTSCSVVEECVATSILPTVFDPHKGLEWTSAITSQALEESELNLLENGGRYHHGLCAFLCNNYFMVSKVYSHSLEPGSSFHLSKCTSL